MPTSRRVRLGLLAGLFTIAAVSAPAAAGGGQRAVSPFASIKQWSAEVVVTSDCDRVAFDGSRTVIHNRIVTTYEFSERVADAAGLTWRGRASTTYRWSVGVGDREFLDVEESAGAFDADGTLELSDSTTISIGRAPGRPFTKKKIRGDSVLDTSTAEDTAPAAGLTDAPLPLDEETQRGDRMEAGYILLGGMVVTCPAQRQWTLHPGAPAPKR